MIPHILIVDDDRVSRRVIGNWIQKMEYTYEAASDAAQALALLKENRFDILLTDQEMPGMKGSELIEIVHKEYPETICVVQSAYRDVDAIVRALNEHKAFYYLFKPFTEEQLRSALDRAYDTQAAQRQTRILQEGEQRFFRMVMETFDWKDSLRKSSSQNLAADMINQLNIGFFQGSGLGALISTLSLLFSSMKVDEGEQQAVVPLEICEMIQEQYSSTIHVVESLNKAQSVLMDSTENLVPVDTARLFELLDEVRAEMYPMLRIKNQRICMGALPPRPSSSSIAAHEESLRMIFSELLINAMKYSMDRANIYVLFAEKEGHVVIKILNPVRNEGTHSRVVQGIDETLVFEPFYRLDSVVDERYSREEFSFGLGLTIVRRVMDQHRAGVFIYTVANHLNTAAEQDNCVTLRFPLIQSTVERVAV